MKDTFDKVFVFHRIDIGKDAEFVLLADALQQIKQEQIDAMLDVLEDISKFPYSPSQLVPWNHILVEINKKIKEIKELTGELK